MSDAKDFIGLHDALKAIAVMGDLSMGQPIDHSLRVAELAVLLARHLGWDGAAQVQVRHASLLRWSGCTANAEEIAATIRDDVSGRAAMLALQFDQIELLLAPEMIASQASLSTFIHCEVSSLVADSLCLDATVSQALNCVFEHWDGSGAPRGLRGDAIPAVAMVVSLCSELEIFSRIYGLPTALQMLRTRAGAVYPTAFVDCLCDRATGWLNALDLTQEAASSEGDASTFQQPVGLDLVGHLIDLKLPWLMGHSPSVVVLVDAMATQLGLSPTQRLNLRRAAWVYGLGRVAIPNSVWRRAGSLTPGERERVRLAPYWTSRALSQINGFADVAELASFAFERMDGSGYFRGARAAAMSTESRILGAAVAWVDMRADRPWRAALSYEEAMSALKAAGAAPLFDAQVVDALERCSSQHSSASTRVPEASPLLTPRELDVLRRISLGDSNKAAAKRLGISPSTVRTHLERVFKKLDCNTRAACTLQASLLGLLR